jgi:hypothetical protein
MGGSRELAAGAVVRVSLMAGGAAAGGRRGTGRASRCLIRASVRGRNLVVMGVARGGRGEGNSDKGIR